MTARPTLLLFSTELHPLALANLTILQTSESGFLLLDGPVTCISWKAGCDGVEDCSGGGDENKEWCYSLNSLSECASGQVLCPNAG